MEKLEIWSKSVDPKGQSQKRAQIGHKKRSHQGQNQQLAGAAKKSKSKSSIYFQNIFVHVFSLCVFPSIVPGGQLQ